MSEASRDDKQEQEKAGPFVHEGRLFYRIPAEWPAVGLSTISCTCIAGGYAQAIAEQFEELVRDLETGFMQGAYARLKNLQDAERERDELRQDLAEVDKAFVSAALDAHWLRSAELPRSDLFFGRASAKLSAPSSELPRDLAKDSEAHKLAEEIIAGDRIKVNVREVTLARALLRAERVIVLQRELLNAPRSATPLSKVYSTAKCAKHKGQAWTMLSYITTAPPAIEVCPLCEQEANRSDSTAKE